MDTHSSPPPAESEPRFYDFTLAETEATLQQVAGWEPAREWPLLSAKVKRGLQSERAARLWADAHALTLADYFKRKRPSLTNDWRRFRRIFQAAYARAFVEQWRKEARP